MRFRVIWPQRATDELADAYIRARLQGESDRVIGSMVQLENILATNPTAIGESRDGDCRVAILPPLVIEYEVFADDGVVVVHSARYRKSGTV